MRLFQELNKGRHARVHLCRGPGMGWGGDGVLSLGRKLDPDYGALIREAFLKYVSLIFKGMMSKNLKHATILKPNCM